MAFTFANSLTRIILALVTFFILAQPISAQVPNPLSGKAQTGEQAALPDPLTKEAIRDLLSTLDDKQVRTLLLNRLSEQADARAKAIADQDNRSLTQIMGDYGTALLSSINTTFSRASKLPDHIASAQEQFSQRRQGTPLSSFFVALIAAVVGGFAAAFILRRASAKFEESIVAAVPRSLWHKVKLLIWRFVFQFSRVITFFLVATVITLAATRSASPDRFTIQLITESIAWVWLIIAVTRFVLAPTRPALRLCPFDDATANLLTWRAGLIAAIAAVGFGLLGWMLQFGMQFGASRFGFWVSLAMHAVIIVTIWQTRRGITDMLSIGQTKPGGSLSLANAWPWIAIGLVVAHWLTVEIIVATGNATPQLLPVMMMTLATLIGLPMIEHGMRAIILNAMPFDEDAPPAMLAAHRETQRGAIRCGRILLSIAIFFGLLWLWSVDVFALAQQGVGARFAGALIDVAIILMVAYAIWELVTIVVNRQIAIERAEMGIDPEAEAMSDGEGGKGESRLATILPLVQLVLRIAIATLASLAIISELGVNITPLLAGAGIIGLAIGFGAQTLVKDVISGMFFLIDDAFRKGEYIDIGDVKGTVEKISVRSMQLRHHNGPLNTVPFGEINFITNFSRDWVVMKLPLRLTYDTDAEKVRKMIKKLGQEMLEDPVLGPQFLQPLKSQGVIQMEDSAMIMRVKFMTKPGDQWVIRRIVFARIRDLFEREGIKFAHREVTVRLADESNGEHLSEQERKAITAAARSTFEDTSAGPPVTGDSR
ncbi:MAG: mechanosensitive ion channel family protein [Pseudomonadota bacterium]